MSGWPPTMMAMRPSSAAGAPPEIGASSHAMPHWVSRRFAMTCVCVAAHVDMSTSTLPGAPAAATPRAPNTTFSSAAPSLTQVMTKMLSLAISCGLPASAAPAATRADSFARSRFHTAGAKPQSIRRRTIAGPSTPAPMQPTRGFSLLMMVLPDMHLEIRLRQTNNAIAQFHGQAAVFQRLDGEQLGAGDLGIRDLRHAGNQFLRIAFDHILEVQAQTAWVPVRRTNE